MVTPWYQRDRLLLGGLICAVLGIMVTHTVSERFFAAQVAVEELQLDVRATITGEEWWCEVNGIQDGVPQHTAAGNTRKTFCCIKKEEEFITAINGFYAAGDQAAALQEEERYDDFLAELDAMAAMGEDVFSAWAATDDACGMQIVCNDCMASLQYIDATTPLSSSSSVTGSAPQQTPSNPSSAPLPTQTQSASVPGGNQGSPIAGAPTQAGGAVSPLQEEGRVFYPSANAGSSEPAAAPVSGFSVSQAGTNNTSVSASPNVTPIGNNVPIAGAVKQSETDECLTARLNVSLLDDPTVSLQEKMYLLALLQTCETAGQVIAAAADETIHQAAPTAAINQPTLSIPQTIAVGAGAAAAATGASAAGYAFYRRKLW